MGLNYQEIGLLIATLLAVGIFVYVLHRLRVSNLRIKDFFEITLAPATTQDYFISTTDKFDFVISTDGNLYKTQLFLTYKGSQETSINNATLLIDQLGWFVLRQPFIEEGGIRKPVEHARIFEKDKVYRLGFEFEPKEGWNALEPQIREYKGLLKVRFLEKTVKHKFKFQIRAQDKKAIATTGKKVAKSVNGKIAEIVRVPIIDN